MIGRVGAAVLAGLLMASGSAPAASDTVRYTFLGFESLEGWDQDDHAAALAVFSNTCKDMAGPEWSAICAAAHDRVRDPRAFFELLFQPVLITDDRDPLFTGYFEPELNGSKTRTGPFQYPVYSLPPEARDGSWLSRREIETGTAMLGRGLELAWVDDPVELFFLQVQGSGRIHFQDGSFMRVGYAGANGHEYRSVGQELVRRGIYEAHQVSADVIRNWVRRNPEAGRELLFHNPSYVFFRNVDAVPADKGPLGAMNRSITARRSIAVDPRFVPLGAPVWVEKQGVRPLNRLMIAQDTGSAIKGAQRADIFMGTGAEAGRAAGRLRDDGRMVVLLPIPLAQALTEDDKA